MIYPSKQLWQAAVHKRVLFFGMSGLGKTYLSNLLRVEGNWFHYSVDYRIGTRYMGEHIADNFKSEAMKVPFLHDLLLTDSIRISSKITFDNLRPLASYLGKPGDVSRGGLPLAEYQRRQEQFKQAEVSALLDTARFIDRAEHIYDYPHFICDSGGSICEWIDPAKGAEDPILKKLSRDCLLVWLKGDDSYTQELVRRFGRAPKPMAYQPEFLEQIFNEYLRKFNKKEYEVDPNNFIIWAYAQALAHRQSLYEKMAQHGVTLCAHEVAQIKTPEDFERMIGAAIDAA